MRTFKPILILLSSCCLFVSTQTLIAAGLDLKKAERLAIERDAILQVNHAQGQALFERSIAADTLPDPKIKLGLLNYPTDSFDREQEPMTQTRVAIQQMLPRGDTLAIKSRRTLSMSEAKQAMALNRGRMVLMQVRSVYLELIYWLRAEAVVKENRELFKKLVKITESQYASGIQRQQDVIRAELELDMLDDRLDAVITKQQQTRAKLAKLIGKQASSNQVNTELPVLTALSSDAKQRTNLESHPKLKIEDAKVASSQYGVELANQSYKPGWMFEVAYAFRDGTNPNGSERADFASVMVSFDIPLFTKDRQDRQVAASQLTYQASLDTRKEVLRELQSEYEQALAAFTRLQDRLQRYHDIIIPQSRENASAAMLAYQSRRGDFTSLMRAQITELETALKLSRLQTDLLKSQARLLYLVGE